VQNNINKTGQRTTVLATNVCFPEQLDGKEESSKLCALQCSNATYPATEHCIVHSLSSSREKLLVACQVKNLTMVSYL
jgi:hypothetical protein